MIDMRFAEFFRNLKRYDQNAAVIFDEEEPIGRPTDLVLPRTRWFRGRADRKSAVNPPLEQEIS